LYYLSYGIFVNLTLVYIYLFDIKIVHWVQTKHNKKREKNAKKSNKNTQGHIKA